VSTAPISTVAEAQAQRTLAPARGIAGIRRRLGPVRTWAIVSLSVDTAMIAAASAGAEIGAGAAGVSALNVFWDSLFGVVAISFLASRGLYRLGLWTKPLDDLGRVVMAMGFAAMAVVSLRVLFFGDASAAQAALREAAFAIVYVGAGRVALYWTVSNAYARGDLVRPTLIVGAGRVGRVVARRLLSRPELGLKPVAFLDDEPLVSDDEELELPLAGTMKEIEWAIAENRVKHVVVTFSQASDEELLEIVNRCEHLGVGVSVVPRLFEKVPERVDIAHLGGLPLVTARPTSPKGWQFTIKYTIDRIVAALALVLLSPILLSAAVAVWISMGRPLFFEQIRIGRDGKPFGILKFRSMRDATAEELELAAHAATNGNAPGGVEGVDRRTRVGTFIRKTSIDELPQLLNVLRGEMSLVGPRPERPEFVEKFEHEVYRYGDRHRCKAGITGWSQVHGLRGKTSISDRAEWDNYYIENFSLGLDLKIALMTLAAVAGSFREVE
jgi:exopolysaccharide biosynthesis polyprenyl glycosylphosphotransferase